MKSHLTAIGTDNGQIMSLLIALVGSIGAVFSIAFLMWLATVVAV